MKMNPSCNSLYTDSINEFAEGKAVVSGIQSLKSDMESGLGLLSSRLDCMERFNSEYETRVDRMEG